MLTRGVRASAGRPIDRALAIASASARSSGQREAWYAITASGRRSQPGLTARDANSTREALASHLRPIGRVRYDAIVEWSGDDVEQADRQGPDRHLPGEDVA